MCRRGNSSKRTDQVAARNLGLDVARRNMLDAVLLDTRTLLKPGALIEIEQVAYADALTAFVSPRTNAPLIGQSPPRSRFHSVTPDAAAEAP
jgi:hypothetical protein